MDQNQQLYLLAAFPDAAALQNAVRGLTVPTMHLAVLGGADDAARAVGASTELEGDVPLDAEQSQQLDMHLKQARTPVLAVRVAASVGRDLRLQLTDLGGQMLWSPGASVQVNDAVLDPDTPLSNPDDPTNQSDRLSEKVDHRP